VQLIEARLITGRVRTYACDGRKQHKARHTMIMLVKMLAIAGLAVAAPSAAHEPSPAATAANAPFEWLIGDWDSEENGNRLRQSLSWGPHRSYVKYSTFMQQPGQPKRLHFEGIAVWNANSRMLDYVFAVEPGSAIQEKGTIRAETDSSIVREVEFTGSDGKVGQFRQTFRRTGSDSAVTSLMRRTEKGWEPNFPGSERIVMTRRAGATEG
jgi:hypothetical protein